MIMPHTITRILSRLLFRLLPAIIPASMLCSCEADKETELQEDLTPLVIEGWIEKGENPVVIVTRAVDLNDTLSSFDGCVEQWCRVSLFEDGNRHILTAKADKNYFPQLIYTSSRVRGKEGAVYRLMVETDERSAEATSSMMPSPRIKSLRAEPVAGSDTLFRVIAEIDNPDPEGYYRLLAKSIGTDTRFYPTFLGEFKGADYDPSEGVDVARGIRGTFNGETGRFSHYWKSGETVIVKLCSIDRTMYDFWLTYDSNISLSNNMLFTFTENCRANISGGLGYWAAYSPSSAIVRIPRPSSDAGSKSASRQFGITEEIH